MAPPAATNGKHNGRVTAPKTRAENRWTRALRMVGSNETFEDADRIPLEIPGVNEPFMFLAPGEVTASLSFTSMLLAGDMTPTQIISAATQIVRDCIVPQERFRASAEMMSASASGADRNSKGAIVADEIDIEWNMKLLTFERLMKTLKVRSGLRLEVDQEDLASVDESVHANPIVRIGLTLTRIYGGGFPTEQPAN
jgi:hypothetical protein